MARRTSGIVNYQGICDSLDAEEKRLMKRVWEIPKLEKQRDELLAALEGCERELKDWCDYAVEHAADLIPTARQETYAALIQARAAIKKARG